MPFKKSPMAIALLALALTLGATACAFSAKLGAASQISVPCGPLSWDPPPITPTLKWTPDGTKILFSKGSRLYAVASDGSTLNKIVGASPPPPHSDYYGTEIGLSADVSPDGSQIVYTTCEYLTEPTPWHHSYSDDPYIELLNYELATSKISGLDKRRLTENLAIDHYPTWSPDGSRVAFVSNVRRTQTGEYEIYNFEGISRKWHEGVAGIYTMNPDGTDLKTLTPAFYEYGPYGGALLVPPQWSPDGERVAFIGGLIGDRLEYAAPYTLYTATLDGLNLRTIAGAAGAPSWSPNGQRLAFMANDGDRLVLRTASAAGGDVRDVSEIAETVNGGDMFGAGSIGGVSWSPNGSAFIASVRSQSHFFKALVIKDDGSEIQSFPFSHAEWSPDGSRIAVAAWYGLADYYEGNATSYRAGELGDVFLHTSAPDGSDRRDLVVVGEDGELRAANPR